MTNDKWSWQEPETAWKGIGIYHVTLTIPSRKPLLGSLVIPDNDPSQALVERTDLGEEIVDLQSPPQHEFDRKHHKAREHRNGYQAFFDERHAPQGVRE